MTSLSRRWILVYLATFGVFIGAFAAHLTLRHWRAPFCFAGGRFQPLSSDQMQQTLPIIDLRDAPITSLYYSHIQPPAFDTVRAVLAQLFKGVEEPTLALGVDHGLYNFYSGLFGLIAALLYIWLQRLTSPLVAFIATVVFLGHPALHFYSTFLEASFLSSTAILLYFVVLWETLVMRRSPLPLAVVTLLLFFTRSNFQWPFVLVTALALFIGRFPPREIGRYLLATVPVIGLFLVKQYLLFGLTLTTSFAGLSACHTVAVFPAYEANPHLMEARYDNLALPSVLTRRRRGNGTTNLNHLSYIDYNAELLASAAAKLASDGAWLQLSRYRENIALYFLPSSGYSCHAIVDALPWRSWYDYFFSESRFAMSLLFALLIWLALSRQPGVGTQAAVTGTAQCGPFSIIDRRTGLALALPVLFIFASCILFDRGENQRFKWFLEPVFYVFVVTQFYALWHLGRSDSR